MYWKQTSAVARTALSTVPGPRPMPIVGPLGNMLRFIQNSVGYARQLFQQYGPIVSLAAGGGTQLYSPLPDCPGSVLAYGPERVREVTTQHEIYAKYPLTLGRLPQGDLSPRRAPLRHFGTGLFGVNGDTHRAHRRVLMPAFHKQRVESYRDVMVALTQAVLDTWQVGEVWDIATAMRGLTMRVAVTALFGTAVDIQIEQLGRLIVTTVDTLASPLVRLLQWDVPGLPYHRYLNLLGQFDREIRAIIARKRAVAQDQGDVLSLLIQARDADTGLTLTDDELLGHTGVIFMAGHETSANALTWTLFLLSQYPQVAADVVDELTGVLHGAAPTVEQLGQLPLLENVIKESMRVITPVPWNGRVITQASDLGGYMLPAGTEVFISLYETHHMPEIYSEPESFNPYRWETIRPTIYEYNPFGAGARMCIGATFALLEMKIVLAMLLQRFRLEGLPQARVDPQGLVVLTPKGGMPLRIHPQDRCFERGVGGVRGSVRTMVDLPG